jgi:hypothetical protein
MNILMLTNVYTPQVGGVTRSIQQYSEAFRHQGHRVLIDSKIQHERFSWLRVNGLENTTLQENRS